jgi:ParB-like chromosome segregation protein Spo0J
MQKIETAEDFKRLKETMTHVHIPSKHGNIPVPCVNTLLVKRDLVVANNYNPNFVSKDKMQLLKQSIRDNGFCFPIVTIWDDVEEKFVIIDGFHRYLISGEKWLDLDYIPIVYVDHDISKRMYATVQFNKARGVHQVDLDADVIRSLIEQGKSEEEISVHLGIDIETIYRYKQLTGIAELFKNAEYSMPWTILENMEEPDALHG